VNPPPPTDDYPAIIEMTIRAFLSDGLEAGALELEPIAGQIWPGIPRRQSPRRSRPAVTGSELQSLRPSFKRRIAAAAYVHDHFECVYCTAKVMPLGLLATLAAVYPEQIAYHVNYKSGAMHPMFWTRTAEADHQDPGSRSGDWSDVDNHATACVICNTLKGDSTLEEMEWEPRLPAQTSSGWDGLLHLYRPFWEAVGKPTGYRKDWLIALEEARAAGE
jgi:hypothetical protein